ncbi:hypothetical protein A3D11_02845 [Candidatus Peribacteria bacterium RIFCSPHIGHO2_02_FULL_49_16]|nr:MAG: hypothetical protein A2880_01715 [Candidatus Peribacteria bacterium RIFCSPHIGHO2_01_FULL_49_38]OGJ58527.1 MAG: hypothetical protein A3D11_02845 [Candidatus Peribacteria bacterium RIFCSPHIGHO2_02_FULL_49_16]
MSKEQKKTITEMTIDEKLTVIADCIEHMNRRDRWRAIGNIIRTIIILLPILIALGSIWYLYENIGILLQQSLETVTNRFGGGTEQLLLQIRSIMEQNTHQ